MINDKAPMASDNTNRRSTRNRKLTEEEKERKGKERNRMLSKIRVRVEHVFGVVKNVSGYRKVRYKGLAKNTNGIHVLFALSNLYMVRRELLSLPAGCSVPGYRVKGPNKEAKGAIQPSEGLEMIFKRLG